MKIRIGTRGSKLALTQTNIVINELKKEHPNLEIEIIIIKTKGDKILNVSLEKIGDKGLFVKEIEEQLLQGHIDIAIHSLKDMPGEWTKGLMLLPITKREDPRDVLVTRHKIKSLAELPKSPVIATGSKRRSSQLMLLWPDVRIEPIRGNVETRIQKMLDNGFDGTVLAAAGINRIKLMTNDQYSIIPFQVNEMIPAPSQGVLGLQLRDDDKELLELVSSLIDERTTLEAEVERAFLNTLHGSCHLPMGAYLDLDNEIFYGMFGNESCSKVIRKSISVNRDTAIESSIQMAKELVYEVKS